MGLFKKRKQIVSRFYLLRGDDLAIYISNMGAELISVKNILTKTEYIWNGNPDYWSRRAPILFPVTGALNDDKYIHDGKEYNMKQHGFARDRIFSKAVETHEQLWFTLDSDDSTRASYPFDFHLAVGYRLKGHTLEIMWRVVNKDDHTMYFSIGGHPAFRCPLERGESQSDYYVGFDMEGRGNPKYMMVNRKGLYCPQEYELPLEHSLYRLKKGTFDKNPMIFENQTKRVSLVRPDFRPYVTVTFSSPIFRMWSPAGKNAPLVSLEPWYGMCDSIGYCGEFSQKRWMQHLEPEEMFESSYFIEFS